MFIGRQKELKRLESLYAMEKFQMVVVYGRRRVGKTALIKEFGKGKHILFFTALDQADRDNLADFSAKVWDFFGIPGVSPFESWSAAFDFIAQRAAEERFILAFDELPYAAARNSALPSVIQVATDHALKETKLFLILCGSNQGFMESEVLGRKSPLYGRRTAQMKIGPLGFRDAKQMLPGLSPQEQFRFYGCIGGVPYYLEQVDPSLPLRENLANLYFDTSGFLYDEPYGLLRQEFQEPAAYASILRAIASGSNRPSLIADRTGMPQTTLPKYLKALTDLGIIERAVPFGESPERSKRAIYRICDACYDFWFTFVMPRMSDIEQGFGQAIALRLEDSVLNAYLGYRFERLCAEWLTIQALKGALPVNVTHVGSWWGANPRRHERDDIDVIAADTEKKLAILGECKYREEFDETAELEKLETRKDLVPGYNATHFMVFSKRSLSDGTIAKAANRPDLTLVTLEEMYQA